MPQIGPTSSHQLAAAAVAFHQARRKFPKNPKACKYSTPPNSARILQQAYPPILMDKVRATNDIKSLRSDVKPRRNQTSDPSFLSSRTTFWSNNCYRNQKCDITENSKPVSRKKSNCATCGKRKQNNGDVSEAKEYNRTALNSTNIRKATASDAETNLETTSKSTHSFSEQRKKRHFTHRRDCRHAQSRTSPKSRARVSQICHRYRNQRPNQDGGEIYCSDSPTTADFPSKLQTWEHRTHGGFCRREINETKRGEMVFRQEINQQKSSPRVRTTCNASRRQNGKRTPYLNKTIPQTASSTHVCLRPSLIKAAQREFDRVPNQGKSYSNYGKVGHSDVKSIWEENLNVLRHKDSMSILMDRFKSNDKHHNSKLKNVYELHPVLGSKTSRGAGEMIDSGRNPPTTDSATNHSINEIESVKTDFPVKRSYFGLNPTKKLASVANQGFKEDKMRLKDLRNRLHRYGICCSPKETPWRRAF